MSDNAKKWTKAAGIRAVKTVVTISTLAAIVGVNWPLVASASTLAGILSLLISVAGLPEPK